VNTRYFIVVSWAVLFLIFSGFNLPSRSALAQWSASEAAGSSTSQGSAETAGGDTKKIADLDIEQLARTPVVVPSMDIPVTSVSKQESTVGHSAAAIFVITPEMIRRSGATCIPEALRMAPGMEVAHIDSNKWAISCRGFNGLYANKLLVLIDGRTVYTPVFSGVYWDTQDVLMEDIERIEVIRGPGGTLYGANAVNGVINVITKRAKDTQGAFVSAGGGTTEQFMSAVRYGGPIGDDGYYRIYGKQFDRGTFYSPDGRPDDAWRQGRFGFRSDMNLDREKTNTLTVQGDCYTGKSGFRDELITALPPYAQPFSGKEQVSGENVLTRLRHVFDEDSDWALQLYYDHYSRIGDVVSQNVRTFDVDFQYRFPLTERHKITCGAGFRGVHDDLPSLDDFAGHFVPPELTYNLTSQFIQDEIALVEDRLTLTMGTKLEQNYFTGLEVQPSARLLCMFDRRHSAWGAISRAVRTPARSDVDLVATFYPTEPGVFPRYEVSTGVQSEELIAYEIGYRAQSTEKFSWDIAGFYNVYEHLISVAPGAEYPEDFPPPSHTIIPLYTVNDTSGRTYGVELFANWSISDYWRLYAQYTLLQIQLYDPEQFYGVTDPHDQVYLRSSWNLSKDVEFDLIGRYVDCIPELDVPSYITMDLRLGWRPRKHLELAVVGQNLLQNQHQEFNSSSENLFTPITYVPRGVYGTITYRY